MKKLIAIVLAVTLLASVMGVAGVALAGKGNGAPTGYHFNLNIIGMQNDGGKNCGPGGHVIFVPLEGRTKIMLAPGEDFYVEDCNGLVGPASFVLPADVSTEWSVWVRALGKPNKEADIRTCGEYTDDAGITWDEICGTTITLRSHKKVQPADKGPVGDEKNQKFQNVSKYLLYIDGVPLFADDWRGWYWDYNNKGLKIAQLRFYPGYAYTPPA